MKSHKTFLFIILGVSSFMLQAQTNEHQNETLGASQQSLIAIAALTANGNITKLKPELNKGLEAGLTINQIKEAIVHIYAYAGFPRSIRGLQTFMEVVNERKNKGINDVTGPDASPINNDSSRYQRGKKVLEQLTGVAENGPKTGYADFAPIIEVFLKEHLFADIFERDILTFTERELLTISVIGSMDGLEPMLRSHLNICLNMGLAPNQLRQFVGILEVHIGKKQSKVAEQVLNEVLNNRR